MAVVIREDDLVEEILVLGSKISKLFLEDPINIKLIRSLIEETGALKGELNRERGIE